MRFLLLQMSLFALSLMVHFQVFAKGESSHEFIQMQATGVSIHRLQIDEAHLIWEERLHDESIRGAYPIVDASSIDGTRLPALQAAVQDEISVGTYFYLKKNETERLGIVIATGKSGRRHLVQVIGDGVSGVYFKLIGSSSNSANCAAHLMAPHSPRRN